MEEVAKLGAMVKKNIIVKIITNGILFAKLKNICTFKPKTS